MKMFLRYFVVLIGICGVVFGKNTILIESYDLTSLFGRYTKFSHLYGDLRYAPFNLFDGDVATAWAEGVEGDGSGESPYVLKKGKWEIREDIVRDPIAWFEKIGAAVYVNFERPIAVDRIRIFPGYGKNQEIYEKNARPKKVQILLFSFSKEGVVLNEIVELQDRMEYQEIVFKQVQTNVDGFELRILSTYRGTMYDDTCVSEVEFWYKGEKYEVANLEEAKREYVKAWREQATKSLCNYRFYWGRADRHGSLKILEFKRDGTLRITDNKTGKVVKRGNWKVDDVGVLWIKVGDGEWKKTSVREVIQLVWGEGSSKRYFVGSDLETDYLEEIYEEDHYEEYDD